MIRSSLDPKRMAEEAARYRKFPLLDSWSFVIFGSAWAEAGVFVQILALWTFFVFITYSMELKFTERPPIYN